MCFRKMGYYTRALVALVGLTALTGCAMVSSPVQWQLGETTYCEKCKVTWQKNQTIIELEDGGKLIVTGQISPGAVLGIVGVAGYVAGGPAGAGAAMAPQVVESAVDMITEEDEE